MDNYELLKYATENGIINISHIQAQIEMRKREQYLRIHPYSIWLGKDGKWYTYLPDNNKPRKKVLKKRTNQQDIENLVVDYWKNKLNEKEEYTFKDVYYKWREVQDELVAENSIAKYDTDFKRYFMNTTFAHQRIEKITDDDIKIFICNTIRDKKLCKESTRKFFGYISNTFMTAYKKNIIQKNPMTFIKAKDFYKYCTNIFKPPSKNIICDDDMKKLQIQFQADHKNKPNYMPTYAVEFASLTGMRVGEIAALAWADITDEYIIISKSEKSNRHKNQFYIDKTKNGKTRLFPMTKEIRELLNKIENVERTYGYYCEWVFANENGRIHSNLISSCSKTKCRQVGVDVKGIHAYRKTLNSKMRCMGVSATVAAAILGHTENVNNQYYTFDMTDMSEKSNILSAINQDTCNI